MDNPQTTDPLPVHDQLSWLTRGIELSCIIVAVALAIWHLVRFTSVGFVWVWWSPLPIVVGLFSADFASGMVHWTADTWGSETMPILGRRFIRPFRVHHVNPHDFLRRDFVDTNGDVAMIVSVLLTAALWLPLDQLWGQATALLLVSFAVAGLPTNQVHQWAHMPVPPAPVRWLQRSRIILSHPAHQRHHASPYVVNYCIATGWCNSALTAIRFFPRLEMLISRLTGWQPRRDDQSFSDGVLSALSQTHRRSRLPRSSRLVEMDHD